MGEARELTAEQLKLLRDVFQQACGFVLRDDLKFIAERRLAPRLEALGLRDFGSYQRYLRFDPRGKEELEVAIDLLLPRETYFFREPAQLTTFVDEVVPRLAQDSVGRTLHAWSAGCSSGEEPYTLSMLMADHPLLAGWELDVLGTDLSQKALATARHAEYGPSSLRATSVEQKTRFFDAAEQGRVRVKRAYREKVRFGWLNLLDAGGARLLPMMDVIFCRNVLIYFDTETRRRVVNLFSERLREGGYLLLGHSENLFSLTTKFELVQLSGDLVYRKPRLG
ncbi:MAG: protein-glutamate O-methyltransferase CheR [Myxococcaceae bacterium]|jgi:chemotaxis protein methyltransferase CheR|nr:protein-glutamate O-methyltransferase CheR [Myxococcaceae bacterium]